MTNSKIEEKSFTNPMPPQERESPRKIGVTKKWESAFLYWKLLEKMKKGGVFEPGLKNSDVSKICRYNIMESPVAAARTR